MRRGLLAAAIGAAMVELTACASIKPPVSAPQPAAIMQLTAREQNLTSLQSSAIMEYTGPDRHLKARERITVRRPADLRVEALSPLGVALIVTANAREIAVFDPSKNTIARGPASAATLDRVARIPLEPTEAVRLLLALPPVAVANATASTEASGAGGVQLFDFNTTGPISGQIGFADGNLAMVRVSSPNQATDYEIHYSDYHDIGAMNFPYTIEATFPSAATSIKLRYELPAIDSAVPDAEFALPSAPGIKEVSLG